MKKIILSLILFCSVVTSLVAENAQPNLALIDNLSAAFENVSKTIQPSVVSISSIKKAKKLIGNKRDRQGQRQFRSPLDEFFGNDFFNRFFEYQMPEGGFAQQGLGSGVIVSEDGYVLTNNHVVEGADELTVTLFDDKKYDAELVGTDPKSDLAVVKIKAPGLHAARLGDSDELKVGQWVVAAGSPFNLEQSITAGIVSAKGRSNVGIADYEDFIQTDAAINPGNSGGPLVSLKGEVVGINTAIFSKSGGYMGVGFAIPSNMVKRVMDSLIKDGEVTRGFIGVMIQKLDESLAKSFNYDSTEGALVSEVDLEGPAAKAGIKSGDIIVNFNNEKVKGPSELKNAVGRTAPDERVSVRLFRDGKMKELKLKVGKLKNADAVSSQESEQADSNQLGVEVSNITSEIKYRLRLDREEGVVIADVEPGSMAQYNGLRRGDIILSLNGKEIKTSEEFYKALEDSDLEQGIRLSIRRKGGNLFLFIKE